LLKIIIAPPLKGVLIYSDFHPLGRGKEGDENHKMKVLRQPQGASHRSLGLATLPIAIGKGIKGRGRAKS